MGLGSWEYRVFSKSSIDVYAQGCKVEAQVDFAAVAVIAAVTEDIGIDAHPITDLKTGYSLTCFHNFAGVLMTQDDRGRRCRLSLENMGIGSADPRGSDFDQDLAGPWFRYILLHQPQVPDIHETSC